MSWLLAFVGFAALIVLHEFGHFLAAKATGMRVERFALFFGPLLVKFRRGETEYGIGPIPLGGYVRITGMNPDEELPPEIAPRAYYRQPAWKRVVVIAAGPVMNVLLAFLLLFGLFTLHGEPTGTSTRVEAVQSGSPAAGALRPGDRIVAVDGRRGDTETLRRQIGTHRCGGKLVDGCLAATPAKVTVERDGRLETLEVRPRYDGEARRMLLGFQFGVVYERMPVGRAASTSVTFMWDVTKITVDRVVRLFYDSEARRDVSGVVGSYEVTRQSFAENDMRRAVFILALISLSLAIINLFPFLPLDGGHIFWALAEKIRGRPISFRVLEQASVVGFVLVLMLFAIGLTNDLSRLSNGGFQMR